MQTDLTLHELKTALASSDPEWQNPIWLDVRTDNEVADGTLKNALHIEVTSLPARLDELKSLEQTRILCFCRSGVRSNTATQLLKQNGFLLATNVGGYEDLRHDFAT
jgi:rhodanese-related sulfurtransferase